MIEFEVSDMTCGGCVRAITAAVAAVAPQATVQADVAARRVRVLGDGDVREIGCAIVGAGFDAVPVGAIAGPGAQGSSANGPVGQGPVTKGPVTQGPVAQGPGAPGPGAPGAGRGKGCCCGGAA